MPDVFAMCLPWVAAVQAKLLFGAIGRKMLRTQIDVDEATNAFYKDRSDLTVEAAVAAAVSAAACAACYAGAGQTPAIVLAVLLLLVLYLVFGGGVDGLLLKKTKQLVRHPPPPPPAQLPPLGTPPFRDANATRRRHIDRDECIGKKESYDH